MIENWWPTKIGYYNNTNHNLVSEKLIEECYNIEKTTRSGGENWISNSTYNTSNYEYTIHDKSKFRDLNNWILEKVNEYIIETNMIFNIKNTDSWLNIYRKGDYQEVHQHIGCAISCVYFLKADEKSSKLIFQSNFKDYMDIKSNNNTSLNDNVVYQAKPGNLIVFRSYLPHCVEKHNSDNDRITLAYNFR